MSTNEKPEVEVIDAEHTVTELVPLAVDDYKTEIIANPDGSYTIPRLLATVDGYKKAYAGYGGVPLIDTEAKYKEWSKIRSEVLATRNAEDDSMRAAKKKLLDDFTIFNDQRKKHLSPIHEDFQELIDIEIGKYKQLKVDKITKEATAYWEELAKVGKFEFKHFTATGVNITFSSTLASVKRELDALAQKITNDLLTINMLARRDAILEMYKDGKSIVEAGAILDAEEAAIRAAEERKQREAEAIAAREAREAVVQPVMPQPVPIQPIVQTPPQTPKIAPQEVAPSVAPGFGWVPTPEPVVEVTPAPPVIPPVPTQGGIMMNYTLHIKATEEDIKDFRRFARERGVEIISEEEPVALKISEMF